MHICRRDFLTRKSLRFAPSRCKDGKYALRLLFSPLRAGIEIFEPKTCPKRRFYLKFDSPALASACVNLARRLKPAARPFGRLTAGLSTAFTLALERSF